MGLPREVGRWLVYLTSAILVPSTQYAARSARAAAETVWDIRSKGGGSEGH